MEASKARMDSMTQGIQSTESTPMSANTDRDFAMTMKTHHQGARSMAQAELKSASDPKMTARKILGIAEERDQGIRRVGREGEVIKLDSQYARGLRGAACGSTLTDCPGA